MREEGELVRRKREGLWCIRLMRFRLLGRMFEASSRQEIYFSNVFFDYGWLCRVFLLDCPEHHARLED